jgi:cell division septum initiation protein DivIVA
MRKRVPHLTPRRIQTADLPGAVRGYDRGATDRLLQQVAKDYEQLWVERKELHEHVERLEAEIAELREQERHVGEALLAAERAAQAIRTTAEREAEALVAKARSERVQLETVISDLRALVEKVRSDISSFLTGTLEQLHTGRADGNVPEGTTRTERGLIDDLTTGRPGAVE